MQVGTRPQITISKFHVKISTAPSSNGGRQMVLCNEFLDRQKLGKICHEHELPSEACENRLFCTSRRYSLFDLLNSIT